MSTRGPSDRHCHMNPFPGSVATHDNVSVRLWAPPPGSLIVVNATMQQDQPLRPDAELARKVSRQVLEQASIPVRECHRAPAEGAKDDHWSSSPSGALSIGLYFGYLGAEADLAVAESWSMLA